MSPKLSEAMVSYATQCNGSIVEEIHTVQLAIEEVRQGQEFDRLAMAYRLPTKTFTDLTDKNAGLKAMALLQIASDAEDSRNLLMRESECKFSLIKEQPESFWGKLISGANPEKISLRMNEIRESLSAVNMVSLVEAMAYQEIGGKCSSTSKPSILCRIFAKCISINGRVSTKIGFD
mgnify:CR=1 FL=1